MHQLTARFRATTPMFLGSARPSAQAQARAASLKGAVRFWWRARAWAQAQDLDALREADGELFGSQEHGQSRVLLSWLGQTPAPVTPQDAGDWLGCFEEHGLRYLSYGLTAPVTPAPKRGPTLRLERPFLPPFAFKTQWIVSPAASATATDELLWALRTLGALGGLGSKARRGFGSVVLDDLRRGDEVLWSAPSSFDALCAEIDALLQPAHVVAEAPPFTAFSAQTRVLVLEGQPTDSPLDLLERVGRELVRFRSFGRGGRVLDGERSERNFRGDHDVVKRALQGKRPGGAPERVAFGLPQPYFFTSLRSGGMVQPVEVTRRASPLMIHVHAFDEGPPCAVVAFLPAQFLPDEASIQLGRHAVKAEDDALWAPIRDWIDRMGDADRCRECFGRRWLATHAAASASSTASSTAAPDPLRDVACP